MHESELGPIPVGWRVLPLDEIAEFLNGLALQKYSAENDQDYLPVIKIRELRNGITNSTDRANKNIPSNYIIKDGDLLFSWSGSLEVKFWVGGEGALNQHLFKASSTDYPSWFCYFWLLYHLNEFRNIAADKATTMGHIKRGHLSETLCLIPDSLERMNEIVGPIIEQLINNEKEIITLAQIRDALLPKLMRGEIEV
jgi:type I restriction enzyme S subunit